MTKHNLTDTTFIIPVKIESDDRLRNAITVCCFLLSKFDTNILIKEVNSEPVFENEALPQIKEFIGDTSNISYYFEKESDNSFFHKTRYFNELLSKCNTDVVSAYDIDVLLPVSTYLKAEKMCKDEYDLVYHRILSRMYEISFVDHDDPFYQLDNNPVYKLRCKQYEYSHEEIDTGITTIDEIEGDLQQDALEHQFTLEQSSAVNEDIRIFHSANEQGLLLLDGTDSSSTNANDNVVMENDSTSVGESILLEGGGSDTEDASYLIQEDIVTGDYTSAGSQDKTAQNELFDSLDDDVLDFSESNPFGDAGGT